jgi:hypothetical protein
VLSGCWLRTQVKCAADYEQDAEEDSHPRQNIAREEDLSKKARQAPSSNCERREFPVFPSFG